MKQRDRQLVYEKYGGRCAYTGKPLPADWQVDHIVPRRSVHWLLLSTPDKYFDVNNPDNLIPTFKILNHYKRAKDLKEWREYLLTLHTRIAKLPKKTRVERRQKYKDYMLEVANHFGISPDKPFSGIFYFETLNPTPNE